MNVAKLNTAYDGGLILDTGSGGGNSGGGGVVINNQNKSVEITENGRTSVSHDAGFTGLGNVDINVNVPPKNQDKSVEIIENGTLEVVADSGFTGLGTVSVNVNVPSSGGGGTDDGSVNILTPFIDDGKTRVWVQILHDAELKVNLHYTQSLKQGISVDFGDGSPAQLADNVSPQKCDIGHSYEKIGLYCITLTPASDSVTYELGNTRYATPLALDTISTDLSTNTIIRVDVGKGCVGIPYAFKISAVRVVNFSPNIQLNSIGRSAFYKTLCSEVIIPKTVTAFETESFYNNSDSSLRIIDCSSLMAVPSLANTSVLPSMSYNQYYKIIVPDVLYDEWIAATNWSTFASYIIKASEFNG